MEGWEIHVFAPGWMSSRTWSYQLRYHWPNAEGIYVPPERMLHGESGQLMRYLYDNADTSDVSYVEFMG